MNPSESTWAAKVAALRAKLGRDPNLNELLTLCRGHTMTPEEVAAQRDSFARAETAFGPDAAEAAYRAAVTRGDRAEVERLDAEAEARLRRLGRIHG